LVISTFSLFSKARLSYDAISQCCWINQAAARQNLATLLIACVNLESGAGFLEGFGHSFNCRGTKGSLVGQVLTDRHRKKLLCCRVIAQAIFASKYFLRGRPFAIFLNECSPIPVGTGGRRSAGRAPLGDGGNASHSAVSVFDGNETAGPPLQRRFPCFVSSPIMRKKLGDCPIGLDLPTRMARRRFGSRQRTRDFPRPSAAERFRGPDPPSHACVVRAAPRSGRHPLPALSSATGKLAARRPRLGS